MPDTNKLFELFYNGEKWEEAEELLKSDEGKALAKQVVGSDGDLPLHHLLRRAPSHKQRGSYTRLLNSLMGVFPDGLKTKNTLGDLPIHVALAFGGGRISRIRKMVEVYPQSLKEKDKYGDLPIHVAVARDNFVDYTEVVAFVIDKHPEGLKTKNDSGDLPIHQVTRRKAGVNCIKQIAEAYPKGLKKQEPGGNLPIHIAARFGRVPALSYFVQRYPEGLKHKNNAGCLPIHLAASGGHGDAMIELAKHYPKSLDVLGGKKPNFYQHPIVQYCSASRLPMYRQGVLVELYKIAAAAPNAQIQSREVSSDSSEKNKHRIEKLRKALDSVKKENRQLTNKFEAADEKRFTIEEKHLKLLVDKASLSDELATTKEKLLNVEERNRKLQGELEAADEKRFTIEAEKQKLADDNFFLSGELATAEEKLLHIDAVAQNLQGDIEILKEVAVEGRKSELAIIASLEPNEVIVSLDIAKSIANSLEARLDGLRAKTQPNSKPCLAQVVFSSVMKDSHVTEASLVPVIESLSAELSKLESKCINGNVTPQSTNGADPGDNRTRALDLSSLDTPGQATKRARVSLSPE